MTKRSPIQRMLGVSIPGLLVTIAAWSVCLSIDIFIPIPEMKITFWLSWTLIAMFGGDLLYLLISSFIQLKKSEWGNKLAIEGPYQFVRHPLYSGLIYSVTGLIAISQQSWSLLISVLPLSIYWSWLVQKEERSLVKQFGKRYQDYMKTTGQFFPSRESLKKVAEKN